MRSPGFSKTESLRQEPTWSTPALVRVSARKTSPAFRRMQVLAFDQVHAHLLGQESVFEIGGVVHARGHDDDGRIVDAARRDRAQVLQQQVGIVLDRGDAVAREQVREQAHHHLAVFQHVGHAGGNAQVVFQDVELARAGTHDVDAGDVGINVGDHVDALHLGAVLGILVNLARRDDAGIDDVLVVVDVVHEHVERLDALDQARLQRRPFVRGDDARDGVEGDQAFGAGAVAIHGEGDADAAESEIGLGALAFDALARLARKPGAELAIVFAHRAVVAVGEGRHLVEKIRHGALPEVV